ncbi:TPA: ParB/RepB/Spo0J family partition protein [Clostridioides difficile]|uniref:ParB-like N-terminal domain-containing protein n=1 Tax=Clostridioides difficile TaxID=1496 RepID=A0A069AZY2_CLODI|nr:ParB N-terminal domain-containing protein [Clostridioides difficile]AXU80664.1 parB-like partition protein [Clostridioides difficile]EGT3760395.1 hypothetical protein [Clostridioides difficile]EGT3766811.1 hypothetical protein [Clostridioides difficile]EGT4111726.1 hypothetical protein [Clostridioides difficile]EGT4517089.1 hypothetical protein [Clostridioides difficile]
MANKIDNVKITDIYIDNNRLWKIYDRDLKPLLESIKEEGLISPIAVQERSGKYKLIAGEHRLTACKQLGWETIPAQIIEREYEDNEIENARLTILEADENLKRKYPDFIAEAHILTKRKEAYDKIVEYKTGGLTPEEYKKKIGGKVTSLLNSRTPLTDSELKELDFLEKDLVNVKTFAQNTIDSTGGSESNINSKLKIAKIIPNEKAKEIKANNISSKTLTSIVVGVNEEEIKKASEIHLDTIKSIKIPEDSNINTLYQKAIKKTKYELKDKYFQRNNPVEFAERVSEKIHEVIDIEEKKKENKIVQLTQNDLEYINTALALLKNAEKLSIIVDDRIVFTKYIK